MFDFEDDLEDNFQLLIRSSRSFDSEAKTMSEKDQSPLVKEQRSNSQLDVQSKSVLEVFENKAYQPKLFTCNVVVDEEATLLASQHHGSIPLLDVVGSSISSVLANPKALTSSGLGLAGKDAEGSCHLDLVQELSVITCQESGPVGLVSEATIPVLQVQPSKPR